MDIDFKEIEKNLFRSNEREKTFQDVLARKKMYYLSDQLYSDVNDINDVIEKLQGIKNVVKTSYEDQKLNVEEIKNMRNHFKGATKTLNIVKDENKRYNASIDVIRNFYDSLLGVIAKIQYLEDIDRRVYPEGYDSRKKYAFVLKKDRFERVLEFIEHNFNYEDYKTDENQSTLEKTINYLVYLLTFASNNFPFGIPYIDKPYVVDQIIKLYDYLAHLLEPIRYFRNNSYYSSKIEACLKDLDKIEEKLQNSNKELIRINGFIGRREELANIDSFVSRF